MPSKYQEYRQMADTAERQLTSSYKSWTQFLRTAARLYKYPYNEQVMIHAQRPDATACAEYDFWNKKMGRFIRRGSTGIALIDTSGQKPQLRYVFDVADTGEREHSRPVHLWRFRAEHEDIVAATLERSYDVSVSDGIVEQMESAATQLAKEYWADHKRDILHNIDDSYLDGYDEFNTEVQFRNAAKVSITYMLMSRCRLEPEAYLEPEDFMPVFDFNTPAAVAALGTAVSEISQQVLRQIEVAIRNYERERSQNHDRIDLHEERRLPDSQPEAERGTGEHALGQVRDAAEDLPSGASPHPLEPDDPVRDAVPAPAGDRRDGATETGADDAGADEVGRRDGESENQRPDEMGRADERLQGAGRRNHSERAGVQLTNDAPEVEPVQPTAAYQMSLFPTEEEQIAYIDTAESVNSTPSAFSMFISQDDIDHILRTGGNADDARMKIVAEFSKQKPIEDRAAFLKNLYYGGNGLITENGRFSAWYGDDGIHIANGDAARHLRSAQVISWADAAERIEALLDDGKFATDLEVTEAPRYERLGIAVDVWNLYHDFSDEAKSLGYLSCLGNIHSTSFPEETERLTDDLLNAAFRDRLLSEYKVFMDAYRENRALLRFHYHKPQALLTRLEDLFLPRKEFRSDMVAVPATGRFITGDEIAASLANGSGFEGGKARIYEFFQTPHTPKESADFLKKEYGIGGRTHAVSRESGSYEDHGSKGITLRKAGCADVQMNWSKVASRISELIRMNRYLTPDEQTVYDKAMAQDALRNAVYNDYNDVKAAYPDEIVLYQVGDFFELYGEDARAVADDLSLELTRRNLEGVGRVTMCGFPAKDLEKYVEKLREKHDVTISRIGDSNHKHTAYTLPSIDHEAENAINAHEAEFGADGTRVFRDPTEDTPQPTVQERLEHYRPVVMAAVSEDTAYRNACGHSDRENAEIECNAAVRRAVLNSKDMELIRLFSDMPEFRSRLHRETFEGTYARLHDLLRPLSQDDIDDALRAWNGNIESKHAVVRYMEQHGREKETAAWLAREYGGNESKSLFIVRAGSPETAELTWPKVQRRLAQLIREDKFFTEQEKSVLEQNRNYLILDRLRADCEYFLGAGNRAEKHLWAGSVYAQIVKMRELYDALPQKPEWLTKEMIDDYADRMAPQYQVVVYHHFENGFDEKRDYQTLKEAEKAAQGYVDGTMESDGFAYDGAAIYDQQARKYLRIYGDYPDERAHAEVAGREPTAESIIPADRFHVVSLDRGFRTLYAVWDDEAHGYYVDADGVTEEFTSEWQAEAYRLELQGQAEQALTERAKGLISDFCRSEYGSEADFSDPAKVSVAYTTVTDDEIPIQVNIDLVNYRLERYLDDEHLETRQYGSLQELITNELENLDFSDLIHVSDEDVEQHRWHEPEEAVAEAPETAPAPQREPFPYSVGDTVYLENGKPYIIESVGLFDITLSDPTLFYPISRAESRESFARLMERYPQPEKTAAENTAVPEKEPKPAYTEETVAVYPGDKNNLPYDVEIRTLRFDEPEHDPPSAEPAEPEPPAMSEEEALLLEQEGRAALSEMGEFVPDFDDAISQAEIDEPPTHRHAVSISIDGEWQGFPSADAAEQAAYADFKAASHRDAQNFHITDDALGVGGAKAKFRANMAAIRLLQELEFEGLQASPEQQEILSRYVGWGGLADAFDESKDNWKAEFAELYAALSPEEYAAARASTLNAHYTSPTVIRAIYDAVENMGFQTGNILEPSMGVGNFFGMLPESMKSSRLYGVELDSITGKIAKQLYPKADITVAGFETTDRKDFFDLAVGNVPFGQYQVSDRAFDKLGFSIHNYFFAKALEQVRPGGVVAFVTSRYTMDAKDSAARKYIAQRADFLGAIRLPNNAFKANAGTDVVSDIIFLQKRDRPIEIEPDWVHLGANADGFAINRYFIDHPEMVLGRQTSESTQYGRQDFTVAPVEGADLAEQLSGAIRNIRGTYAEAELPDLGEDETIVETIPADPNVRNFSYTVVDGELYYRQNSIMTKPDFNATAKERAKGMVELRDCVQKLISQQMDGFISDETIRQTQAELNTLYDGFTAKYGLINSRANALAFAEDSSYYLLCSLEELDEDKNLKRKADMFTRRTIRAHEAVTSVDTASEALALSISEKACVDMEYMAQLTGKDEDALASDLRGVIFRNPENKRWETADEYLSGNVREKLRIAQSAQNLFEGDYAGNVEALKAAQPKDLDASEIEVRLGATWIDPSYIREFMWETFETPFYQQRMIDVTYSAFTAEWNIRNKNAVSYSNIAAYMTYGTERANAYKILEDTLNLRDVRIYDTKHDADGRERRVLNSKETTLAQQKQQAIRDAFRDWIWRDPDRRHTLVARYNELFNSTRPREYDGSHITFAGMNPEIRLREHQLNAVAHVLYGGNTLLAHEVGAGKTFEMVAAAMESKRLGLCHKSLFVVPNHLTEQWSGEFLRLYPSANILVATKKDFEPKNRKKFCARIATGEYDAVIIGHSQFEKIPVSMERQQRLLAEQIFEVEEGLRELKSQRAERFTIKSLERTKRGLEAKLKKLQDSSRKDDVVTFEQLGVDRLYVDEAHNYKNLFLYTKMRNVAGLSATDAQKSSDMLLKCRYIDEITDSRGVVFATGTPVSNSMTELYTMMRYLQHDAIRGKGLAHFDCWASTFGETQTAIELAPEGTGYRARTRFAKFFNLPELMTLFKEAADIKTSDQLNLPTPTPIYHNEVAQPTEIQKQMVQELSERAARVHAQLVDPSTDNMLKITSDGRKLGLDQRIINPDLPDDPNSKVNRCVDNIHRIWQDGQADRLTQLVFCDLSTPKTGATGAKAAKTAGGNLDSPELNAVERLIDKENPDEPGFTVYDDIREKLVARGIPREQIAFIHEANTEVRKKELFAKVRSGQVRVLMGSTFKMGAGMNVQDRLVALHDLDCPWRPGDLEQRSGRIIRQGNRNKEVHIYRYVTESTFDAYLWQTVENKQKFISQIMTSKSPVRSCEDVDETALSYAEIKALCAGDKRIKEKMDLDVDVARLKLMKASHQSQQFRLEDNLLRHFPEQIRQNESFVEGFTADMQTLSAHPHPVDGFAGMEVKGDLLTDKDNAGAAILEAFKDAKGMEPVPIGSYRGFAMSLTVEDFGRDFILTLKGKMNHRVTLGKDVRGNLTRIDNVLSAMPDRLQNVRNTLDALTAQMETAKAELGKPFPQEDELRTKSARLAELNAELNIDERTPMEQMAEDAPAVQSAKAERPSVLAKLKAPLSQPCAEDKNKHRNKAER
jgi:N12 class adenine-specific DNA methylase